MQRPYALQRGATLTETSSQIKFRGIPVYFDGQEWIVPPLSVRQFRDNLDLLTQPLGEITPENTVERMNRFVPVIGMALRRNYPGVTDEHLLDALDLRTFIEAVTAVQKASGMKVSAPGEAVPVAVK